MASGLSLSDFSNTGSSLPVDFLIGFDYYCELATGSVCRGVNGPTAVHTKQLKQSAISSQERHFSPRSTAKTNGKSTKSQEEWHLLV